MQNQWDCVLNDFEKLGGELVLTDQYFEICSWCFRLLSLYSSTFHQTKYQSAQNHSKVDILIIKTESLHLLLGMFDNDEEEHSVGLTLGKRQTSDFMIQYQLRAVLACEQGGARDPDFALAFIRLAKVSTFVFNVSSNCTTEVSCSLLLSLSLLKSVTNLFKS